MKNRLFLLVGIFTLFLILQLSFVSASLCKGYDGYYHDCGRYRIHDGYGKLKYSNGHSSYSYSDHNVRNYPKDYVQHSAKDYGRYDRRDNNRRYADVKVNGKYQVKGYYEGRSNYVDKKYYRAEDYFKYDFNKRYSFGNYYDKYGAYHDLKNSFYDSVYSYEPARDFTTYKVHVGTNRYYKY